MPDIPILGQTKPADPVDAEFEGLDEETKARLAAMADEEEGENVATAFFVVLHHNGTWEVQGDISTKYVLARPAGADDVLAGASVAVSDVQTTKNAQATALAMMQMSQAAQQQMAAQQQQAAIQARIAQEQAARKRR